MKLTANIIRDVVNGKDATMCVKIADTLRMSGFNYGRIYRLVSNVTGISEADWDALLYEGENP